MSKEISPINEFIKILEDRKEQFARVLPPDMKVERWLRVAESFLQSRPDLMTCDRTSLWSTFMRAAQEGLYLDGREGSITSFRKNFGTKDKPNYLQCAQFMAGYIGILKKVRKSGELASINAYVVHEKDKFKRVVTVDGEQVTHEPSDDSDPGPMVKVWCVAKTKDGATYVEVMNRAEIEKVRNVSRSKDSGPWVTWFDEMAKKSIIRRLSKRLPMGTDVESVFKAEDEFYDFESPPEDPPNIEQKQETKKSRLAKIVAEETTKETAQDGTPEPETAVI